MSKRVLAVLVAAIVVPVTGLLLYSYRTTNSGPFQFFEDVPGGGAANARGFVIIDNLLKQMPSEKEAEQYLSRAGFLCTVIDRNDSEVPEAWSTYEKLFELKATRMLRCSYRYGLPGNLGNLWYVDAISDEKGIIRGHVQNTQCGLCF